MKRANGEGSVYRLPSGAWRASCVSPDGRRLVANRRTKTEALAALHDLRIKAQIAPATRDSLESLVTRWLASCEADGMSPSTIAQRQSICDNYVIPQLGDEEIGKIRPARLDTWRQELECGDRSKQCAFNFLHKIFDYAITLELLTGNPLALVKRPRCKRKKLHPFTPTEAQAILDRCKDADHYLLIRLGFSCGLRPGELFGLRWQDVDFPQSAIHIRTQLTQVGGEICERKPKTLAGQRSIVLPADLMGQIRERHKAHGNTPRVFTAPHGGDIYRTTFSHRVWRPLLAQLGIEHRGLHHLRHTYATNAILCGEHANVVAAIMGHEKSSTTWDTYAHVAPKLSPEALVAAKSLFCVATPLLHVLT